MPNSERYQMMQQPTTAQQPHRRSHQKSPVPQQMLALSIYTNPPSNSNNNSQYSYATSMTTSAVSPSQSSAYFLDRVDLEDYTSQTLKRTVNTVLSKMKSKGLKVKISLPDEGLVIDNIPDPMQSWIFKTSELLYVWRDAYYSDVIVVVTKTRSRHQPNRPFSGSLFRLRSMDSAQAFVQTAQQFFAKLAASMSTSSIPKHDTAVVSRSQTRGTDSSSSRARRKNRLSIHDPLMVPIVTEPPESPQQSVPIRLITRAEFDPGQAASQPAGNLNNRRTISETTASTDSQTTNSAKEVLSFTRQLTDHEDEDEKMTTVSTHFSGESVSVLMRELKELRNEIAALKVDKRMPPSTRSMSTSPMGMYPKESKKMMDSSTITSSPIFVDTASQSEVDAETQTDFSLTSPRRRYLLKKNKKTMVGSGSFDASPKSKSESSSIDSSGRTLSSSSTTTASEQEEALQEGYSYVSDALNDTQSTTSQEQYQPIALSTPPRPALMRHQKHFVTVNTPTPYVRANDEQVPSSNGRSTEEGSFQAAGLPVIMEKETSKFLSTYASSSSSSTASDYIQPSIPVVPADPFAAASTNEPIYENVANLAQTKPTRDTYYTVPKSNGDDSQSATTPSNGQIYYTISHSREVESHPSSASNSTLPQLTNGVAYLLTEQGLSPLPVSQDTLPSKLPGPTETTPIQKPQIVSSGRHRSQPVYFANHLTNPMFNMDKQLLINTIANQFGVDLQSPQLQNLILNQHLFVARKRTFANMVWQMTPDEETALCSSSVSSNTDKIDVDGPDLDQTAARSILKPTKQLHSTSKRRSITWDTALQ